MVQEYGSPSLVGNENEQIVSFVYWLHWLFDEVEHSINKGSNGINCVLFVHKT